MTTTNKAGSLSVHVPATGGLRESGYILVFQVMSLDKERLGQHLATLNRYQISELETKMRGALDLRRCEHEQ